MTFYLGQKVVCVDHKAIGQYCPAGMFIVGDDLNGLTEGVVYTIRELGVFRDLLVCKVSEIIRPYEAAYGGEAWFARARFRPVVERKTDISVFKAMLNPVKKTERA